MHTPDLRENYMVEQHRQLIDIVFGVLQKEEVSRDVVQLFDESWFETYLQERVGLWNKIITWAWGEYAAEEYVKEHAIFCLEIAKLLQYPLWFKKPLAYKHIAYDDFKPWVNHKFVIFTDYTGAIEHDAVVLITWTGATQHKDHLSRFLSDHAWNLAFGSALPYLDNLWWGRVKYTDEGIMPYGVSWGLGATSHTMKKIIFETLFPEENIVIT